MVRVNYPPGGEMKLQGATQRQPQTVRVLKPPGGGSSISFTDDEPTRRPVKNGGSSSPVATPEDVPPPSPSSTDSPASLEDPRPDEPVSPVSKEAPLQGDSPQEGMTPMEVPSGADQAASAGSSNPHCPLLAATGNLDINDSEPLVSEICDSDSKVVVASDSEFSEESSTRVSMTETTTSSVTIKHESTSTRESGMPSEVASGDDSTPVDNGTEPESVEESQPKQVNGHGGEDKKNHLPQLSIPASPTPSDASQKSPQTPLTPQSPSAKPNEDTKDRVFGRATKENTAPETPPPRKVVDHMRSNIFMNDEADYAYPTRTSRMNAPAKETVQTPQQNVPAAGQRQRIPPGGFSTRLW